MSKREDTFWSQIRFNDKTFEFNYLGNEPAEYVEAMLIYKIKFLKRNGVISNNIVLNSPISNPTSFRLGVMPPVYPGYINHLLSAGHQIINNKPQLSSKMFAIINEVTKTPVTTQTSPFPPKKPKPLSTKMQAFLNGVSPSNSRPRAKEPTDDSVFKNDIDELLTPSKPFNPSMLEVIDKIKPSKITLSYEEESDLTQFNWVEHSQQLNSTSKSTTPVSVEQANLTQEEPLMINENISEEEAFAIFGGLLEEESQPTNLLANNEFSLENLVNPPQEPFNISPNLYQFFALPEEPLQDINHNKSSNEQVDVPLLPPQKELRFKNVDVKKMPGGVYKPVVNKPEADKGSKKRKAEVTVKQIAKKRQ